MAETNAGRVFLRRAMTVWSLGCLVLAGMMIGAFANEAMNPPNITTKLQKQTTGSTVSFQTGVTFVYTNQYSNMTFAHGIVASVNATWNPAVGPGWCIDGICLNLTKTPSSYPSAIVNVSQWTPSVSYGTVLLLALSTPADSTVVFTLKNFAPGNTINVLKDSSYYGQFISPASGNAAFTYFAGAGTGGVLEFDILSGGGGGGPGGPPSPIHVRPSFAWRTAFALFNATADQIVYFTDLTPVVNGSTKAVLWDFGDGVKTVEHDPTHFYNYTGISAAFNVTETVCLGTSCNTTMQVVTLIRWSTLELVLPLVAMGLVGLYIVARIRTDRAFHLRRTRVVTKRRTLSRRSRFR